MSISILEWNTIPPLVFSVWTSTLSSRERETESPREEPEPTVLASSNVSPRLMPNFGSLSSSEEPLSSERSPNHHSSGPSESQPSSWVLPTWKHPEFDAPNFTYTHPFKFKMIPHPGRLRTESHTLLLVFDPLVEYPVTFTVRDSPNTFFLLLAFSFISLGICTFLSYLVDLPFCSLCLNHQSIHLSQPIIN